MTLLELGLILLSALSQGVPVKPTAPPTSASEIASLRAKAESGDPASQFALGQAYDFGAGVSQDDDRARAWYLKSAEQGYAPAQNSLGIMYRSGRGGVESKELAVEWYRKAARQNYAKAMFNLGTAYFNGDGVALDDVTAYAWFLAAKDHGSDAARDAVDRMTGTLARWQVSDAYGKLAGMYDAGTEVQQDVPAALNCYRKAAELGDAKARVTFAQFLVRQGGDQNFREALHACEEAAKEPYSPAGMCAGVLHEKGIGAVADLAEAAKWYNKSAQLGNALAMERLSEMYWNGSGVKQDRVTAYAYALLASTADLPDAKRNRENYEKELSAKDVEKGKKQASNWLKEHPVLGFK